MRRNGLRALCKALGARGARVKASFLAKNVFGGNVEAVYSTCDQYGLESDRKAGQVFLLKSRLKGVVQLVNYFRRVSVPVYI